MDEIEPRAGFVGRLRLRAEGWLRQLLAPIDVPFSTSDGVTSTPSPGYRQLTAMSSLAAFPWVRACVRAKVDDVGGLPLVAARGAEEIPDHPFLNLIRRPSPGVTGTELRRQLEADLVLTGNWYLWLLATPDGWELHRLHPEWMRANVRDGRVVLSLIHI